MSVSSSGEINVGRTVERGVQMWFGEALILGDATGGTSTLSLTFPPVPASRRPSVAFALTYLEMNAVEGTTEVARIRLVDFLHPFVKSVTGNNRRLSMTLLASGVGTSSALDYVRRGPIMLGVPEPGSSAVAFEAQITNTNGSTHSMAAVGVRFDARRVSHGDYSVQGRDLYLS